MTFVYACEKCSSRLELQYGMGKAPRSVPCPSCKSTAKRVYEATAIHFKGTGWPSKTFKFKKEMTEKNDISYSKMRDSNPSAKHMD